MSVATLDSETFTGVPRYLSPVPDGTDVSEAEKGFEYLRVDMKPQGRMVAEVMQAANPDGTPLYPRVVVQIPRRSAKTTSVQAVLLGRCFEREGYLVVMTAQSQKIARRIFLGMVRTLKAAFPDEDTRPFKARIGNGQEELEWDNGSRWWVVAPTSGSFRSEAADVLYFEEGGEYSEEVTDDLMEGALPLLDTRPHGQVVVAGTPPKLRSGMLWKFLTKGRAGSPMYGIVDFSMAPGDDPADRSVWARVHAGLASGLTRLAILEDRFADMPLVSFMREYLCADPPNSGLRAIDEEDWAAGQVDEPLPWPEDMVVGFDVAPDGSSAGITAAWLMEDGTPVVQPVEHRAGYSWLSGYIARMLMDRKRMKVRYDNVGNNVSVVQELKRRRGVSLGNVEPVTMKQASAGVGLFMNTVTDRRLVHPVDAGLDEAVAGANFRFVQDSRLFGRRSSTSDVTLLVAGANALFEVMGTREKQARPRGRSL